MPSWQRVGFFYLHLRHPFYVLGGYNSKSVGVSPGRGSWRAHEHIRPGLGASLSYVSNEASWSTLVVKPGFGSPDGYTNRFQIVNSVEKKLLVSSAI